MNTLLHKMKLSTINTRLISVGSQVCRRLSTESSAEKSAVVPGNMHNLYNKLSKMWSTGNKVSDVLDEFGSKNLKRSHLVHCIKKFRKFGYYQHCFEILEWMEKSKIDHSYYGLRLNIICKVKGIDEAEKYFDSLSPKAKNSFTYGALFNCYCSEKMIDKALAFFEEMDKMNYASNEMAFSNLMCLYMKVGQPGKVPPLVEKMKQRKIPLRSVSYQVWVQSCACLNDFEGLEQIMEEIQNNNYLKDDWGVYSSFASAYTKAGKYQKAEASLKKIEEILDALAYRDRTAHLFLITLYAGVGDLKSVVRTWDKLKSKFKACNNISSLTLLNALSKLDNIELLKKYFEEWNSKYKSYDVRLPSLVIDAYLRHDMFDEAELLLKDAKDRGGQKLWAAHVSFMKYFLGKRQIDSALRHLEVALANQWPWHCHECKLVEFFEYFIEEKDVDGAEQLCQMLAKSLPLTSPIYLGLLQTYAAAGKTAPEMRQKMAQGGIEIGTEHEELLKKLITAVKYPRRPIRIKTTYYNL